MAALPDDPAAHCSDDACVAQARRLAALLRDDDVDTAIEAGLMEFVPCPRCAGAGAGAIVDDCALVSAAQQRLRTAWDARERYRARTARLQRRAAERAERRAAPLAAAHGPRKPALPPAAAAALARAKARAAGKP
ncbi:hypothetical protein [Luteimonas lutimaris]|uniref:Transcription factor zinc-finger domain-containing protein n=1 Tax=Luteimonas lutimaris TaxID=698645 RepID=A0ABP7MGD3_9GAMM